MKLTYRLLIRLAIILLVLMGVWSVLFYLKIMQDVNDETDDALDDFSEMIISRVLSGRDLPSNTGANILYEIIPVGEQFVHDFPSIRYYHSEQHFPHIGTEPARVLTTVFRVDSGSYYLLKTYTPTIDKEDLLESTAVWMGVLYILLLLVIVSVIYIVLYYNLRPLYKLLAWLDKVEVGKDILPLENETSVTEFRRLNQAAVTAMNRYRKAFEAQKEFIGNASHELQTPLAIIGNKLEWLVDSTDLTEVQLGEILGIQRTLGRAVRLNKTLLLLTKIDNGQFPEVTQVCILDILTDSLSLFMEIYGSKNLAVEVDSREKLVVRMNESLASALVNNLLKNAFIYTPHAGSIKVQIHGDGLSIANTGESPLDEEHIFDRFYKNGGHEGSMGLGLAIVGAIQRYYNIDVKYRFEDGMHIFSLKWH